jgi:hypothetical protein
MLIYQGVHHIMNHIRLLYMKPPIVTIIVPHKKHVIAILAGFVRCLILLGVAISI